MPRKTSPALAKIWIRRKEIDGWPIKKICEVYGISRSTFYRWYNRYKSGELDINDTYLDLETLAKDLETVEPPMGIPIYYDKFKAFGKEASYSTSSGAEKRADLRISREEKEEISRELPEEYNSLYLYLLPRDPYWAFAYWEVPRELRFDYNSYVLRILDVSEEKPYLHFDIDVGNRPLGSWYIPIGIPGREYQALLFGVTSDGDLRELVHSNRIYLPKDAPGTLSHSQRRKISSYDLEMKIDWAISSLADYLSSYYLWF